MVITDSQQQFIKERFDLGFNKIRFPILIVDGHDLDLIINIDDFFIDVDLYFYEFDSSMKLIDSTGQEYTWNYDNSLKTNYPGNKNADLSFDEVRLIVEKYFENVQNKPNIKKTNTISELYDEITDHF